MISNYSREDFSPREQKLIESFGKAEWMDYMPVMTVYDMLARHCFINNLQGANVEALRRGCAHFFKGGYRMTKEFDELISFEEEQN